MYGIMAECARPPARVFYRCYVSLHPPLELPALPAAPRKTRPELGRCYGDGPLFHTAHFDTSTYSYVPMCRIHACALKRPGQNIIQVIFRNISRPFLVFFTALCHSALGPKLSNGPTNTPSGHCYNSDYTHRWLCKQMKIGTILYKARMHVANASSDST